MTWWKSRHTVSLVISHLLIIMRLATGRPSLSPSRGFRPAAEPTRNSQEKAASPTRVAFSFFLATRELFWLKQKVRSQGAPIAFLSAFPPSLDSSRSCHHATAIEMKEGWCYLWAALPKIQEIT
ncbi:protein of unknown function [Candidatus Methylomirabilis oxygeniifera]|uniref:Uncharacterized protein n=1 Tax=Methylomirabilis oxygeniifera TaxID=671143 RepID=D5MLQ1_METO1|nr:protein of unknown function [Candidatus Methylomirabilis oxyfera]